MKRLKTFIFVNLLLMASFVAMVEMSDNVDAATLTVGDDQTYKRIQWAINNASAGDVIRVHDGTYDENIVINVSVTLQGNGTGKSIIQGDGTDHTVTVEASNSVIEDFSISVGTTSGSHAAIYIDSSYDFVKIESCNISNSYYGIRAYGSSSTASDSNRIFNNTITGCEYAVYLYYGSNNLVRFNNLSGNEDYGIYTYRADYSQIENNTVTQNDYGIRTYYADYSLVANNTLDHNRYGLYNYYTDYGEYHNNHVNHSEDYGIYQYNSDDCMVENNTVRNSGYPYDDDGYYGIRIYSSPDLVFKNNSFHNCGAYMEGSTKSDWTSMVARDNEVNHRDLIIIKSANNQKITPGAGQVILIDCEQITVEEQNLSRASAGVIAAFSTSIDVNNCDLGYNNYGVHYYGYGEDMDYMNVTRCHINHTSEYAVYYEGTRACEYSNVSSNTINGGDDGIYFDMSSSSSYSVRYNHITHNNISHVEDDVIELEYSSYSKINDNRIIGGDYGIYTDSSSSKSFEYSEVLNNHLESLDRGIYLDYGDYGMVDNNTLMGCDEGLYIYYTDSAQISNNTVEENLEEAIYVYNSDGNAIRDNMIERSIEEGIYVYSSDDNEVRNNTIKDCHEGGIYISSGSDNNYNENTLTRCGFYFGTSSSSYWTTNNINSDNKVNDREVYLKTNTNNLKISKDVGQVLLYGCDGATLEDAEIEEATVGVQLSYCDHAYIENTTLGDQTWGIELYRSNYAGIKNCTISGNSVTGIVNEYSDNVHIYNNTLDSNGYPTHDNGEYAVEMYYSQNVKLENNTMMNSGVYLYGSTSTKAYYNSHDITNNTVNDRDLLYLKGNSSETLTGTYGQIILVETNSITIKDQDLSKASVGVTIVFSDRLHLEDLTCSWNYYGIYFDSDDHDTHNNTIESCEASYNIDDGIYFYSGSGDDADDNLIANCTISHNGDYGIYFYYPDKRNTIFNNTIHNNEDDGVYVYGSSSSNVDEMKLRHNSLSDNYYGAYLYYTIDAMIEHNEFNDNEYYGLYFRYGDLTEISNNSAMRNDNDGFYIYDAESTYINNNTAGKNGDNGMDIYKGLTSSFNGDITYNYLLMNDNNGIELGSGYRVIRHNSFVGNTYYGLDVDGTYADDNQIDHNIFVDNNIGGTQSYDDESDNEWDDGAEGNYWSDHQTPDADSNNIVDDPYQLEGGAGSSDNYPLVIQNSAPSISTTDVTTATEDTPYEVDYDATDSDANDAHIWLIHTNSSFLCLNTDTGLLMGTPENSDVGSYFVEISVYDMFGDSDSTNFTLTVSNVNDDPTITTENVLTATQRSEYSVNYDARDVDPTDDDLTWYLETNSTFLSIDSGSGILSGTPMKADIGIWWVNVTVKDGKGGSDWTNFTLTVEPVNDIPEITIDTTYTSATEDMQYSADFDVEDLDTDDVHTWSLHTNATFLEIVESTGVLSGTPNNTQVGKFWVNVSVDDGNGGSDWLNFTLAVSNVNDDPNITTEPNTTAIEDMLYSQDFQGIDVDPTNDILTWSHETNATFLSFNAAGPAISGTPGNDDVGSYFVNVSVRDGKGGEGWLNYTLSVENVNDPPELTMRIKNTATEDEMYTQPIAAVDIDPTDDVLTWDLSTDADFLNLDTVRDQVYGTPTNDDVGTYTVNISVMDDKGGADWIEYTLEVTNTNDAPEINTTDLGEATEDELFHVILEGWDMDPSNDQLTWTMEEGPDWLLLDPDTGNLSGTPMNQDVGVHTVVINLTDDFGAWDVSTYSITVFNVNDDPIITTTSIPDAVEDELYWTILGGSDEDPTNDMLTWAMETNAGFLSMDEMTGNLSGTPGNDDVGEWWVLINLSDPNGGFDTINLTLQVMNVNDDPEILNTPEENAVEDSLFHFVFQGRDIDPTDDVLTWSLQTNAPFLSIDPETGNLSGIPGNDDVGMWEVNVTLSDGNDGTATVSFMLEVVNVNDPPEITTTDLTSATENELYHNDYDGLDIDNTDDILSWELSTDATFLAIDESIGNLSGTPGNDDVGEWWVNVTLMDGRGGQDWSNFTLTVENVNDPPILNVTSVEESINEDGNVVIDMGELFSDPDGDQLSYDYIETENFTVSIEGVFATITPKDNWSGVEEVTLLASDGSQQIEIGVTITVDEGNARPTNLRVNTRNRYGEGGDQTVSAEVDDPDTEYGDTLTFSWTTETGEIGTGETINLSLPAGEHTVTVTATDSQGETVSRTFTVTVEEMVEEDEDGEFPWWIIILVVAILIVLAVILFLIIGRRKKEEPTAEEETSEGISEDLSDVYAGTTEGQVPAGAENEDVGAGPGMVPQEGEEQPQGGGDIYGGAETPLYPPEETAPESPERPPISEQDTIPAEEPTQEPPTVSETPDESIYSEKEEAVQKPPDPEELPTQEEIPEPPSGPPEPPGPPPGPPESPEVEEKE